MAAPPREIYLAEGFDPSKLKVAQLRSVLLEHGVHYPSTAKKADLVYLVTTHVLPRAAQILAADAKVMPSARGIIAVSENGDESPVVPPEPVVGAKRARGRPKKSVAKVPSPEVDELDPEPEAEPAEPAPKKARSRRSTVEPESRATAAATPKKPRKSTKRAEPQEMPEELPAAPVPGPSGPVPMTVPRAAPRRKSRAASSVEPPTPSKRSQPEPAKLATSPKVMPIVEIPSPYEGLERRGSKATPRAEPARSSPKSATRVKHISDDEDTPRRKPHLSGDEDEGTFSDFNPFQAGSTDAAQAERRRRKSSLGLSDIKRRAPRPSEWTATSVPASVSAASASALAVPTPILRRVSPSKDNIRSPPDHFRDQMRQEITFADEHNRVVEEKLGRKGDTQPVESVQEILRQETGPPVRRKSKAIMRPRKKPSTAPTTASVVFSLLVFLLAGYYKTLSSANGYCDAASATNDVIQYREGTIANAQACVARRSQWKMDHDGEAAPFECDVMSLPAVPFFPRPTDCTPCPQHATCVNGEVIQCAPEYILTPHILSPLAPLVDGWPYLPSRLFPPTCKPDTARMRQVGQLARQIEAELATNRGNVVCGGDDQSPNKGTGEKYGKQEQSLRESFAERRVPTITREQFDELFSSALQDLVEHGDVVESIDVDGQSWYAASRTDLTLTCRAKLEAKSLLDEWKSQLFMTGGVIGAILLFKHQIENAAAERKRAKELARVVLKRLQDQEQLHYIDPVTTPQPYLPPAQLRDVVLPASESQASRARLWARVEAAIEKNANVTVGEREVRGDMWKTWEWTGVGQRSVEYM